MRRASFRSLALVALVLLAACGGSSKRPAPGSGPGPGPGLAEAPTPQGTPVAGSTAGTIVPAGGSLASPGGELVVSLPAGAVAAPTAVRVTPIANLARGAAGPAFRLEPEGTVFAAPVTLTFKGPDSYPPGTSIDDLAVATQDARGFWRRVEPVTRDRTANTVSVTTSHFSDWALVLALDTAAAEGPISLVQTVAVQDGLPFTASGRATLYYQGDDAADTTYLLAGYLTILDPTSSTSTFTVDGATCVPDQQTVTLPLSVAEVHKGSPPVFRWGVGASWTLTCTGPGGARTVRDLPSLFDTLGINMPSSLSRCGVGGYGTGQVVTSTRVAGSWSFEVAGGADCGSTGRIRADWDLATCIDGAECALGVDCRLGVTVCNAGLATCVDGGPAPDLTACGPGGAYLCSANQCVNPLDPAAGIRIVAAAAPLVTTEAGAAATFTVVLDAQPTTTVSIALTSTAPAEGRVSPAVVLFTPASWNVPQTVTITGVDDLVMDGDQAYTVLTSRATSGDPRYSGRDAADVSLVNLDDDVAGFVVSTAGPLVTTEAGGQATFTVRLRSQPTADVVVPLRSTNPAEGIVAPASLTFTVAGWDVAQAVTVTGVDDLVVDGPQAYAIASDPVVSADPVYAGTSLPEVPVTNLDDDVAGVVASPASGLVTRESGGAPTTFAVRLSSQPVAEVTVAVTSANPREVAVSPASALLTFTPGSWNVDQLVEVTGVDDLVVDGDQLTTVSLSTAGSADPRYAVLEPAAVTVTNLDDDLAGFVVSTAGPLVTSEAGRQATFTVRLRSQPTAQVTVPLRSTNLLEGTVAPAALVFTADDWAVEQVVTVTGVDDFVVDGPQVYAVTSDPATSADPVYAGTVLPAVPVTNLDDDAAAVLVAFRSPPVTTEAGGSALVGVRLASRPAADVTVTASSGNPAEVVVTAATQTLTFIPAFWDQEQLVELRGVDDSVVDGDQLATVTLSANSIGDPLYAALPPVQVTVTNQDDDHAGVLVSVPGPLETTEGGGRASFTVRLTSQPTADVVLPLRSTNPAEGTVAPASLTFTADDWNVEQVVTVTGVDDALIDGPQVYAVTSDPATSADPLYAGTALPEVGVTNLDDDVAGLVVSPASGLVTRESGGAPTTFTVRLSAQPNAGVSVAVSSVDPGEVVVSPATATLTFEPATWNVPQTVELTGVDDFIADGDQLTTIVLSAAGSADASFATLAPAAVTVTNLDDDLAGFVVSTAGPLVTTEAGGKATFTVRLRSQPVAPVTVPLRSTNLLEGTVAPAALVFTADDWAVEQVVTVSGVDDFVVDGAQAYAVTSDPAVSADPSFAGTVLPAVPVTNLDDDVAGVLVTPTSPLVTTEGQGTATFDVVLGSQPTGSVTITLASSNTGEVTVSPVTLTFTPGTWNQAQPVVLTGVDDFVVDGDQVATITLSAATSGDPLYAVLPPTAVAATNQDDDHAGVLVTGQWPLGTTEAGGKASFTVRLASQPTADVLLPLRSTNTAEGTVAPASVTFTAADWFVEQVVTVTGVDDSLIDGPQAYAIASDPAVSADPLYAGTLLPTVPVVNADDDVAGIVASPASGLVTRESGGTPTTFSVRLSAQPAADVTVTVSSSNTAEVTVSPATALLTFTSLTWNVAQTVELTGVDDFVVDGDQLTTISLSASGSADPHWSVLPPVPVTVTNLDDDVAGVVVSTTGPLTTTEAGGKGTFTVRLRSQPTADVTLPLRSTNTAEGTVAPASLTFTSVDWNVEQVVTVTGVDDHVVDGDQPYAVVSDPALSADPLYAGTLLPVVSAVNRDDDVIAILATPASGLITSEAGTTTTFDVVLATVPAGDVTITVTSSNPGEVLVAPLTATLTFTPGTWNLAQTVQLEGVPDHVVDGDQLTTISLSAATSADAGYAALGPVLVTVTNLDVDHAGIDVAPTAGLQPVVGGATATFTVVLTSRPAADVVVPISSSDPTAGTVAGPVAADRLTFTSLDWDQPQTVTVTGLTAGASYSVVTGAATSADPLYDTLDPADVSVTNGP